MTIYSRSFFESQTEQAAIPAPLGRVLRAQASQAISESPLPSLGRLLELDRVRKYGWAYQEFDAAGAEGFMAANGLPKTFTFEEGRKYNQLELSVLYKRKVKELKRSEILARAEGGVGRGVARLGTAIGVSLLDPINIASAFIPVYGEARYAQLLARAGGSLGRAAVRARVGAIEGVVGAAAVEPLIYAAKVDEQADYTMVDSLANVAFGGVFGSTLHSAGGFVSDLFARAYAPQIRDTDAGIEYRERSAPSVQIRTPASAVQGATQGVRIGERYVPARWAVMEADDIRATLERADNQYRDRNRAAGQAQIRAIASGIDFNLLGHSPIMDFGAPTLTADGAVIGGNGRLAAIQLAYNQGTGTRYRDPLVQQAAQFGLTPAAIAKMRKPVLVRVLQEEVDTRAAAIASNEGGSMRMSALEQAKVDSERLGDLRAFKVNEDGTVSLSQSAGAVRKWVNEMPDTQRAALMSADGRLSAEGLSRLRNAILHRAYGDSPTLTRLIEAVDPGSRNVAAALTRVAGRVAEMRASIRAGDRFDLDLSEEMRAAVETLNRVRESGQAISDYLSQGELIDSGLSPAARELLAFMGEHIRSSRAIADFIDRYYDAVDALGSPKQAGLFGTPEVPDKAELLRRAASDYIPSAAERVEAAPAEVQQAAARVAVAQAADGQAINVEPLIDGDRQAIIAAAQRADDPDGKPLNDPAAAAQVDELVSEIPANEQAELAAAEKALAETEIELNDVVRDLTEAGVIKTESEIPELADLTPAARRDYLEIRDVAERAKGAFDASVQSIARFVGGDPVTPPLKSHKSSASKITTELGGDARKMKDVLRATIMVDSIAQARDALDAIRSTFEVVGPVRSTLLETKSTSPAGYRDIKVNVRVGSIVAEIQVNTKALIKAKDGLDFKGGPGHKIYERTRELERKAIAENRDLTEAERAEWHRLQAEAKALYDAAFEEARAAADPRAADTRALNSASESLTPFVYADDTGKRRGGSESKASPRTADSSTRTGTPSTSQNENFLLTDDILAQLPDELRLESQEAQAFAQEADRIAEIARMASICATRSAA